MNENENKFTKLYVCVCMAKTLSHAYLTFIKGGVNKNNFIQETSSPIYSLFAITFNCTHKQTFFKRQAGAKISIVYKHNYQVRNAKSPSNDDGKTKQDYTKGNIKGVSKKNYDRLYFPSQAKCSAE